MRVQYFIKKTAFLFCTILTSGVLFLLSSPTSAITYSSSITTSDSITLNASSAGDGINIHDESVTITTNCADGYNLTLATTGDSTLYLDGDSASSLPTINPIDSTYSLSDTAHNVNTWGYSLTGDTTTIGAFSPLSSTPSIIKTTSETASDASIEETFSIYYGTSINSALNPGSYSMGNNGTIDYYLTIAPSCADSTIVSFNENLDGAGSEGTDSTIANFPTTSDNTIDATENTITLSSKRPTRNGYIFKEWNTEADGSGDYYYVGETIPMGVDGLSGFVTLYAVWVANCPADTICYNDNHADGGTMTNQSATSNANNVLIASNFDRSGYGFAGWNTEADGTGTSYGPNQTINPGNISTTGLTLFAHWLEPTGIFQTWAGASNMNAGDVIALKDNRDNEVYAVAKLTDNNVWIIENLRLAPNSVTFNTKNTNSPTAGFISAAPSSSSTTTQCSTDDSTCNDRVFFYSGNMDRTKTQEPTGNDSSKAWYSYGTMYNWFTATAGNGTNGKSSGSVTGDICPSGWRLPTGGSSGEYSALSTALGGTSSAGATALHSYPNNFINSGDYNPSTNIPDGRGTQGRIWTSTAQSAAKSYRMGYNNASITPAGTWNKWDNFAVRCIYQGGNTHYSEVTINFAGSGITSVTFENNNYDTETATPSSPTVEIAKNVAYTITATTSSGYELSNWTTTSTGTLDSTAANPTTYTITDNATLTATGTDIPSYEVTVNLDANVSSVSFTNANYPTQTVINQDTTTSDTGTVNLRRGVEYTLTSSYETGYTIDTWTTTANGTLGSATSASTTYTITGTATLGLTAQEANELSYTLVYNAGNGTDAPNSETVTSYNATHDFTITNSAPIYYGYTFTGWTETNGGSTIDYTSGDTLTITSTGAETTKTLYAVYTANSCPSGKICYYDNGADVTGGGRGTMANQSASSNSSATLIPSNYSKSGYGFAGWATDANATPYGPNATITTPDISSTGLALYAKWVAPTGALQSWNGCNTLTRNSVIALTDTRDDNVYAVAKLADDNCWTIESLRLVPNTATITSQNTHNPASGFAAAAANSSSSNALCNTDDDSSCINQLQYNTNSLNRNLTQSYNGTGDNVAWYSYGVYYNWYTATAGQGTFSTSANTNVSGDLCPKNWHLPTSTSSGEWAALNTAVNGGVSNADAGLRTYPVNLIWSGDYNGSSRTSGYSNGRYWSSTGLDANNAYRMGHQESGSKGSTPSGNYRKWDGFAIRCVRDEGTIEYSDVVVTFPANVTSVSFTNAGLGIETATPQNTTISLAQGATYTITATFASGYTLDSWTNSTNSTIGSTTANPTTFSVTDDSTLALTTKEICGITIGSNAICYDANGNNVEGTMGAQTFSASDTSITLLASNFSRTGYGFAGWSPDSTITSNSKIYGPQEDLTMTAGQYSTTGLKLYAVWVQSAGSMQSDYWNVCKTLTAAPINGTANINSVSALTDQRDNETYAVAKLADGNCWMIENMRLENTGTDNTSGSLAQGYNASFAGLANPEAPWANNSTTANSLYSTDGSTNKTISGSNQGYRFPRYNNVNTPTTATDRPSNSTSNSATNSTTDASMYSYGNYYTWAAAIADTTDYTTNNQSVTSTSICPTGWHLPKGGDKSNEANNDFWTLVVTGINGGTNPANYDSSTQPYYTGTPEGSDASNALRAYPNNFVYSGYVYSGSVSYRGSYGGYWSSSTANSGNYAYFMGIYNSNVYPGTNYGYKYTGRSIRCLASIPTHSVTISPNSHISSVTFSASGETDQTATSANPTVSLKEGKSYTITATGTTGYEFASWSTTANGTLSSTTTNPTTYAVTDTATLTITSQVIPTYTITVNMDSNITGITFANSDYGSQSVTTTGSTITLRRGVPYTITTTTATGYEFASWSTTANGTLGSTTTNPTTYTITDTATLTIASQEVCSGTIAANSICYAPNGNNVEGTMGVQTFSASDTSVTLLASNFSRAGYGFAGWSPDSTITNNSKIYGPQENLTMTAGQYSTTGLKLYAVWVQSAGYFQTDATTTCNSLTTAPTNGTANISSVSALTDQRDGETYAVAKLADGNCWMIENMRLENTGTDNTNGSLAQGYNASFAGLANPEAPWADYSTTANSLYSTDGSTDKTISGSNQDYRFPRYNNINTPTTATDRPSTPTSNYARMYRYGNYYTWAAAIADTTDYTTNNQSVTSTSICPTGWHLPKGGNKSNEANNDFWALVVTGINGGINPANYDSSIRPYYTGTYTGSPEGSDASNALRAYPNNFVYSGSINGGSVLNRGAGGDYWSSTAGSGLHAYHMYFDSSVVYPGTDNDYKYEGRCIRCVFSGT